MVTNKDVQEMDCINNDHITQLWAPLVGLAKFMCYESEKSRTNIRSKVNERVSF